MKQNLREFIESNIPTYYYRNKGVVETIFSTVTVGAKQGGHHHAKTENYGLK